MKRIFNTTIGLFVLTALLLTACGSAPQGSDRRLSILASTTFLADIARNVTGERASVDSLLPIGTDPHSYQATPSDVVKISESTVLILNGLEYEHFIESLLENADGERHVITATDGLEPHELDEQKGEEHAEEEEADEEAWSRSGRSAHVAGPEPRCQIRGEHP
jgi:ABC-type Zn uptake system ZnuABC Zn-binding protein ZnuA